VHPSLWVTQYPPPQRLHIRWVWSIQDSHYTWSMSVQQKPLDRSSTYILSAFPAAFGYQGLWHRQHTSSITTHSNYSVPQRERPSSGAYKSGAGKAQLTRSHGTELDTLAPRHLADPKAIPRFLVHSEQRPSRTLGLTMDTPPPEYSLTVITPSSSSATTVSVWLTL